MPDDAERLAADESPDDARHARRDEDLGEANLSARGGEQQVADDDSGQDRRNV